MMLRNKLFLNILFVFIAIILIISYCGNDEAFYYNPDELKTSLSNSTIISYTTLVTCINPTNTTTSCHPTVQSSDSTTTQSVISSSTNVSSQNSTTSTEQSSNSTSNMTSTVSNSSNSSTSNSSTSGSTTSNSSTTTTNTTTTTVDCSLFNSLSIVISTQPTNGIVGSFFNLGWNDVTGGEYYIIDLYGTSGNVVQSIACSVSQGVQACSYSIATSGYYFYKITAKKTGCLDLYATSSIFNVMTLCGSWDSSLLILSLQPTNGLEGSSFKVNWTDIPSGENYIVDLMSSSGSVVMSNVCSVAQGVQTCSYAINSTGSYFYRVTAKKIGCSDKFTDSNIFSVSVNCTIFNANVCSFNIQPTNGVAGSSYAVAWNPIPGANEYVLDLCSTSGTSIQAGVCSGTSSFLSCTPTISLAGAYTFKLTAKKTGCADKTCNSSNFYVINGVVRDCLNPVNLDSVSFPHPETGTFMGTWQVASNCGANSNHMIVYSFTPTANGNYMINCTNSSLGTASSWISIFAYSCTDTEVFCCGYAGKSLQTRVLEVYGGIPYYVIFYTGGQNQLLINPVIKISQPPTPISGNTCATAQIVSGTSYTLNIASTIEYPHPDILCSWESGPLNWMSFNLSALSDVLTVNWSSPGSGGFFIDCSNTMVGCFSNTNSATISASMGSTINLAFGSGFCGVNVTPLISFTFSEGISSTGENCFKAASVSDAAAVSGGYLWSFPASAFQTHDHNFGLSCSVAFDGVIRYYKSSSTSMLHVVGTMFGSGSETLSLEIQPTGCSNLFSPIFSDCANASRISETYISGDVGFYYIWFGSGNSSTFKITYIFVEEAFPTAGETCDLAQVLSQGDNTITNISAKRIKPPNCFPQNSGNIDYYKYTMTGNSLSFSAFPSDHIAVKNITSQAEKTCLTNITNPIKFIVDPGDIICFRVESIGAIAHIYINDQTIPPFVEIEPNNNCSQRTNLGIISGQKLLTGTVSSLPCSTPDQYDYYEFIPANTGIYYFLFELEATWGIPFTSAHLFNYDCSAIVSPAGGWTIASSCNGSPYFPMTATAFLISNSTYVLEICDVWGSCEGASYSSLIYQ